MKKNCFCKPFGYDEFKTLIMTCNGAYQGFKNRGISGAVNGVIIAYHKATLLSHAIR